MRHDPLLTIENISKAFPVGHHGLLGQLLRSPRMKLQALDGVSLKVEEGQTVGLVGESGSGKSTLGRCVVRLHSPDSGAIRFDGTEISGLSDAEFAPFRRQIQMIFQDPFSSLNPRMTVGAALSEVLVVHHIGDPGGRRARVSELIDMVGLPADAVQRLPGDFSGGQRQRIGIARALTVNPRFLIADEPVSALDVSIQAQIINLLSELQTRLNLSMLFISHDLRVVHHISNRVAVMYLGRIVEDAPTETIFRQPLHPYTRVLIETAPKLEPGMRSTGAALPNDPPSPLNIPKGCRFHPRCRFAMPQCKEVDPLLVEVAPDHFAACHLVAAGTDMHISSVKGP